MFGKSKRELQEEVDHYKDEIKRLQDENNILRNDLRAAKKGHEEARDAAQAWDNFLDRHQTELENLRQISKQRKAEVAELNRELSTARRIEDAYANRIERLEIEKGQLVDQLNAENPMLEVRQAHQEAAQWQERCEDAEEKAETLTDLLYELRDTFEEAADIISAVFKDYGVEGQQSDSETVYAAEERYGEDLADFVGMFAPVYKVFISGEEIDDATQRHWKERDK